VAGPLAAAFALAGWAFAGAAHGAGAAPSMEVLPQPTGLKYGQTVEIKGHHLPKGSGSVAATICGLDEASGKAVPKPTADDCAGAAEVGKLVIVKSWQSNGEFDTKYTLPKRGQRFGKNARYCDKTHHCALVVGDANPSAPAYHVETRIQFVDEASTAPATRKQTTTTPHSTPRTKPNTTKTATSPSANQAGVVTDAHGCATSTGSSSGFASTGFSISGGARIPIPPPVSAPSLPAPTLPAPGGNAVPAPQSPVLDQVCTQLASAVKQASGDPTALLAACTAIASGNGPAQLSTALQSPSLLCIEGASAWQNDPRVTNACNQAAAALAPIASPLGGALEPVLKGP
jgi:hypothetical protein